MRLPSASTRQPCGIFTFAGAAMRPQNARSCLRDSPWRRRSLHDGLDDGGRGGPLREPGPDLAARVLSARGAAPRVVGPAVAVAVVSVVLGRAAAAVVRRLTAAVVG